MTMTPGLRKFALAAHLTLSVGWVGAVAAYMALDVAAATSQDAQTLRAAYLAMEVIARYVIVPLAFASLGTGLVMSLGTKWGLFRHYWVLISLLLTTIATVVLLVETQTIGHLAGVAADPATSGDDLRALPSTLGHSVGGMVVLVVVLVLNVYKPRGMTRYGQRKQREQRTVQQRLRLREAAESGIAPASEEAEGEPVAEAKVSVRRAPARAATSRKPAARRLTARANRRKPAARTNSRKPTGRTRKTASRKPAIRRKSAR